MGKLFAQNVLYLFADALNGEVESWSIDKQPRRVGGAVLFRVFRPSGFLCGVFCHVYSENLDKSPTLHLCCGYDA